MQFDDKELEVIISRKVDKVIFQSKGQNIFQVDIEDLMKKRIENDPQLKKQLLSQVLRSED